MGETPEPITALRPDTPAPLAELVMRCLEKDADTRPQQAAHLVQVLETVTSGGGHAPMPAVLLGGKSAIRNALLAYAAAFVFVAILAKAAIVAIGLPDWVFPGSLIVMALGLPVILFMAYVQYATRKFVTQTPTFTPGGSSATHGTLATMAIKASPHMSWRRTWIGGSMALGAFVLLIAGYMGLRAAGIGKFGSLIGAGTLQADERLLVTDFSPPARDTSLGPVITDAFRTALGQSRTVTVMQPPQVADVLRRMQRPANTHVDFNVGREIATREGIRGVVVGDIISLGGNYAIAVRLVSPQNGEELWRSRETASSDKELLGAIDKLAKDLRSKIGESLRQVQSTRAFEQVTTPSLEALKKYVAGSLALSLDGDFNKGGALLEQAIALDTGFAMAYRKLAVEYNNRGQLDRAMELLEKAYRHRDRLTDVERYYLLGSYYQNGPHQDVAKSTAAYESAIELQPDLVGAVNNVANSYRFQRNWTKAEEMFVRAIRSGSPPAVSYGNLVATQLNLGKPADASRTLASFDSAYPANFGTRTSRATLLQLEGKYDSAQAVCRKAIVDFQSNLPAQSAALVCLQGVARTRGQLREEARRATEQATVNVQRGLPQANLNREIALAYDRVWFLNDRAGAVAILDKALAQTPLEKLPVGTRPFQAVATTYSLTGRPDKVRGVLAAFDKATQQVQQTGDEFTRHAILGAIALAEKRYDDAITEYRAADGGLCMVCQLAPLAYAYDLAGQSDSALAVFERYLNTPDAARLGTDAQYRAVSHKRLGELYEARNDTENALSHYLKFVDLWKNADPELQPRVTEVRARIARLRDRERR
jgi:tetratricopeptide (TPR) repeat protein